MSKVIVDKEKLAYGLEKGIGQASEIYGMVPKKYRLRTTVCGLASAAIEDYSRREGIQSRLVISRPVLDFDPRMCHVLPLLGDEENFTDLTAVDASYSQFLSYAGLHWGYETYTGTSEFPPEKIMVFKISQRSLVANFLTQKALAFQQRNTYPKENELGIELGRGPLESADEAVIRSSYLRIWNPSHFEIWSPSNKTAEEAEIASRCIPRGTISIE